MPTSTSRCVRKRRRDPRWLRKPSEVRRLPQLLQTVLAMCSVDMRENTNERTAEVAETQRGETTPSAVADSHRSEFGVRHSEESAPCL